jgi:phenylalanyl-tRNA synthetase beta chain
MIATRDTLIGLGGVMGGGDTEVDEHTKNIIIEAATFDMYSIRRTSMAHGLFTDAVTRFNKGQSPLQNLAVQAKIVDEIRTYAGGKVASEIVDINNVATDVVERGSVHPPVTVTPTFMNERLGLHLSADEITQLLRNVEFGVEQPGDELVVKAPFWRTDIEIPEDVVEEVGRLYGYDHLPLDLPMRNLTPARKDAQLEFKRVTRDVMRRAGANEVLTYSFVHGNLLDKVGQDKEQAYQVANALSPDLQYYRLSLTPSLLEKVHSNIKAGHESFALFELGKVHAKGLQDTADPEIPGEANRLAFVYASDEKPASRSITGAAYYEAKHYLETLLTELGIADVTYATDIPASQEAIDTQSITPYAPGRMSYVIVNDMVVAILGEYKSKVRKGLKLPAYIAGFELDIDALRKVAESVPNRYNPLPRFPKLEQDICLRVAATTTYGDLYAYVRYAVADLKPDQTMATVSPVDIYQREHDTIHKQITFRLSIASYERTLTDVEIARLLDQVAAGAQEKFSAERV